MRLLPSPSRQRKVARLRKLHSAQQKKIWSLSLHSAIASTPKAERGLPTVLDSVGKENRLGLREWPRTRHRRSNYFSPEDGHESINFRSDSHHWLQMPMTYGRAKSFCCMMTQIEEALPSQWGTIIFALSFSRAIDGLREEESSVNYLANIAFESLFGLLVGLEDVM